MQLIAIRAQVCAAVRFFSWTLGEVGVPLESFLVRCLEMNKLLPLDHFARLH